MMQTDILCYGADLAHYLLDEFVYRDYARYTRVQRFEESRCGATSQKADRGFVAAERGELCCPATGPEGCIWLASFSSGA
jgi:hypothetical protein